MRCPSKSWSWRDTASSRAITIETALDRGAGQVTGDFVRLQQVVANLLSNAFKFTGDGGYVSIRLERAGEWVCLLVADNGQGIEPDELPRIFDRFHQAEHIAGSATARQHGGLGLGLAIVKHIVELHGGTVRAESAGVGMGATFIVELPILGAGGA